MPHIPHECAEISKRCNSCCFKISDNFIGVTHSSDRCSNIFIRLFFAFCLDFFIGLYKRILLTSVCFHSRNNIIRFKPFSQSFGSCISCLSLHTKFQFILRVWSINSFNSAVLTIPQKVIKVLAVCNNFRK